jgi:hypothetical protein
MTETRPDYAVRGVPSESVHTCSACGLAREMLHSVIERQEREIAELRRQLRWACIARDCRRRVRVEVDE